MWSPEVLRRLNAIARERLGGQGDTAEREMEVAPEASQGAPERAASIFDHDAILRELFHFQKWELEMVEWERTERWKGRR